jgi:hypothetical protein
MSFPDSLTPTIEVNMIYVLISVVVIAVIATCVIANFNKKRRMRRYELLRHINMITDPNGCASAKEHLQFCRHISSYYGIPLIEVGFDGGMERLRSEVARSLERAAFRREQALKGISTFIRNT